MDCLDAQRIISEALDGERIEPNDVRDAKAHCAGCRDCLGYVKSLAAARRAPAPEPPADLVDRVMARVREEADALDAQRILAEAAAAVAAQNAASTTPVGVDGATETRGGVKDEKAPVDLGDLWARLRRPENRRALAIWVAAAAVLLVFVGVAALSGVNAILKSGTSAGAKGSMSAESARQSTAQDTAAAPQAPNPDNSAAGSAEGGAGATVPSASYVVAGGFVYQLVGPSTYARSNLTTGGTTTSSLGGSEAPKAYGYYLAPEKSKIVLDDGTGSLLVFDLVTRDFAGRQYGLRSGDLTSYKQWPTLPPPMENPANPDGAPQFQPTGTSMGVPAYVRSGTTADAGIAIGPNTPPTDPAAGNPNWTWWTPLP